MSEMQARTNLDLWIVQIGPITTHRSQLQVREYHGSSSFRDLPRSLKLAGWKAGTSGRQSYEYDISVLVVVFPGLCFALNEEEESG